MAAQRILRVDICGGPVILDELCPVCWFPGMWQLMTLIDGRPHVVTGCASCKARGRR